jgi:hypothetical protein
LGVEKGKKKGRKREEKGKKKGRKRGPCRRATIASPPQLTALEPAKHAPTKRQQQGSWHDDGKGHPLLIRETEDLRLAYAGPLQMGAEEMPEEMKYFAAATGRSGHLPHELSIWRKAPSQKVLDVTWDDAGKIELITYEPGEWEEHLAQG